MSSTNNGLLVLVRILLSFMFIMAGYGKLVDPAATAGMISGSGLPAADLLAYAAGLYELVAGLFILVGFQTKVTAWTVALFCVFTGFVFHSGTVVIEGWPEGALGWINTLNQIMLMKNVTLAGGYIALAIVGAGAYSIDARRGSAQAVAA